ncbi:MAG: phosphohydrolase [Erysipelotrichaceae bacterium]
MNKAICSRNDLVEPQKDITIEFVDCIRDILDFDDIQQLKEFHQHLKTTRFQHSINVSYYSFLLCRKFNLDYVSAARAGLVHDLFLYDWKNKEQPMEGRHSVVHPIVALQSARELIEVNDIMADAIVHHMWPMSIHMPRTAEGWILQGVDKLCAIAEITKQSFAHLKPQRVSIYLVSLLTILLRG